MPKTKRIYKERKVYYFICSVCGRKNAQTFHKKVRRVSMCRKCKRNQVDKNQIPMF